MEDPKRSAAALLKGARIPSLKDTPLSSLKSDRFPFLQVSCHPSLCRYLLVRSILPRPSWAGFTCTGVVFRQSHWHAIGSFLCMELPQRGGTDWVAVSTPFNGIPLVVWLGFTTSCRRTFERILRLLVSACFSSLVFHAVSLRPGLVKLLALSNFQARRRIIYDSIFTGLFGQQVLFVRYHLTSVLLSLRSNALFCHRYLEPNGCSAPILLLLLCTVDDLTPERFSRL